MEQGMTAKKFKNFTAYDFTWKYNGIPHTFKSGETMMLEDFKADHFAKHLVDEELNRQGKPTNDPSRKQLTLQCFEDTPAVALPPVEAVLPPLEKKAVKGKINSEVEFPDLKAKAK